MLLNARKERQALVGEPHIFNSNHEIAGGPLPRIQPAFHEFNSCKLLILWSGRLDSNPRDQLGNLAFFRVVLSKGR
jgi:hypothetical protein